MHCWFHSLIQKNDDKFCDHEMSESLLSGKLLHSLFASLLMFTLSSKIRFKICHREEFNRCKSHRMDKICFELETFEEFATYSCVANCDQEMFGIV